MTTLMRCKWLRPVLAAAVLLALVVPPLTVSAAVPPFRGEYYNNRTLSGTPVLIRDDPAINFDWDGASPGTGVNATDFSVRWTNFVSLEAGTYRFTLRTDDGSRLWVDEVLILDRWVEQAAPTYTADRTLAAGYHSIRLEYFQAAGGSIAQFSWEKISSPPAYPDWKGEYWSNVSLTGTPVLTRNDTAINFNWGYGSPAPEVPADNFSCRWTRTINVPTAGVYTFSATSDDGIRVKVDGTWVINRWVDQPPTTVTGNINLTAGNHEVIVEHYERGGTAEARVSWALSTGGTPAGTIVVDDKDPDFLRGGTLTGFKKQYFGYNGHLFWVWNNTSTSYYWGKWVPRLPGPGTYEVQVYIPRYYFGTTSARYRIIHNGQRHDKIVSQALYYDQWVSLGSYYFHGGGGEYVMLASATGEPYATRPVGFDAVRFIGSGSGGSGATPTPTSTAVGPTPTAASCSIMPVLGFGEFWNSNATVRACLGCPTASETAVWMAEETFVGGKMMWRQDTDMIYCLFNDGTWQQFPNSWTAGEPETDPDIVPPSGYYQPRRGFGKLWRNNSVVRSKMSWATNEERGFTGAIQPFQTGLMFWSPGLGIHALCNSGLWYRY
ncbi:MAG: PA14 domain-containing protein [Anaerolineae bacterium]